MGLKNICVFIVIISYVCINIDAFFILKALKKELFCKKTCVLYCRPKRDKIVDIHHYHSFDVHPHYNHHHHDKPHLYHSHDYYHDIETTTKATKPEENISHLLHHHFRYKIPHEDYYYEKDNINTETPKPIEKYIPYSSKDQYEYEDVIEKIVTTTKKAMPYLFGKHYEYKDPYYADMVYHAKRETTTKEPNKNIHPSHYRSIEDMLSDYVDDEYTNVKPRYKRGLKHFGYYVDVRHTHEFIKHKEDIKKPEKEPEEELSGICMFCMKKCHYPKPPD